RFFLLRVDVADCFNNIDHTLLLEVFRKTVKTAMDFSTMPFCPELLISELSSFLSCYIIKLGGQYFMQTKGIPQGACVSVDLANLYLARSDQSGPAKAYFWRSKRKAATHAGRLDATILRFHDDYLCIATSKERLLLVRNALFDGLHKFGLRSNASKETSNIEESDDPIAVDWLGLEITPNLDFLLPTVICGPRTFDRFSGYPLSWRDCLWRLSRYLRSYDYFPLVINQLGAAVNCSVAEVNARRLGQHTARLVIFYVWPCPERHACLASVRRVRRLAEILLYRLAALFDRHSLVLLSRDSLVQCLHQRRSEFRLLLRFLCDPSLILRSGKLPPSKTNLLQKFMDAPGNN
uniref:Telomerase reverse transcriptase n=1 Tax=Mesocestoides corti TaxID=53468 RepID=A0A5K3F648_MESCO